MEQSSMPAPYPQTTSERSDDIPLLIHQLQQLKLAEVLDAAVRHWRAMELMIQCMFPPGSVW